MKIFPVLLILFTSTHSAFSNDRILIKSFQEIFETAKILAKIKTSEKGHKFVFTQKGEIIVSTTGGVTPKHGELAANSGKVVSAGYLNFKLVQKENDIKINEIYLDNRSGDICPDFASLAQVFQKLLPATSAGASITVARNPNIEKCGDR